MNHSDPISVSEDIKPYLDEIAERLWSGHAAVMVGAGFSKNAECIVPHSNKFSNWDELGDTFHKKIHGCLPEEKARKQHYLNVLKLANEVDAAFGRPALDSILRDQIPDKNHKPSSLHTKLLELPWTDVFTTNYDTLLERAGVNIPSIKYDIVIKKEDIVHSERPRIIKLHGSFPSARPFIITEEDYRKYPQDFAPFVNTVQQALLENTLCLIGFSGDDPNFLQWIGWIRDNLGKDNSPKIYLIGIFELSSAQIKLLEKRNIILIDLSACNGIERDHKKALKTFFEYLSSKKQDGNRLNWPTENQEYSRLKQEPTLEEIKNLCLEWRRQREDYPNWIIAPEDIRKSLWLIMDYYGWKPNTKSELPAPLDVEILYEFNWRLEKCLCPIMPDYIETYETIINRYNPFPSQIKLEAATIIKGDEKYQELQWDEIQSNWLYLQISLMRSYREEGLIEKWGNANSLINVLKGFLTRELIVRWHYERCLAALFSLDIPRINEELEVWPKDISPPFWEAKRAGLLAELGRIHEAEEILEKSLAEIRSKINLSPVSNDYGWISKESYVMQLLQYVKNAIDLRSISGPKPKKPEEIRQQFMERWNTLKQYKCDPWNELKLFEAYLENTREKKPIVSKHHSFDIGSSITQYNYSGADNDLLNAYHYLRYIDEIGIPFRICNRAFGMTAAKGALKRISFDSPYWAFITFLRIGDPELIESMLNRESIFKMDIHDIDSRIYDYLNALKEAKSQIEEGGIIENPHFGIQLAALLPKILSRLCIRCSQNANDAIFEFLKEIYTSEHIYKYRGISNLSKRLIGSWSNYQRYQKLPELIHFPLLCPNEVYVDMYPDPFKFVSIDINLIKNFDPIHLDTQGISQLLEKASSEIPQTRQRAICRLTHLFDWNLLNPEQTTQFNKVLWSQLDDQTKLPANTGLLNFAFLSLPHPESVDPIELFKSYVHNSTFPVQKLSEEKGIRITQGEIKICSDIIRATKTPFSEQGIDWSYDEILHIFHRLLNWWDADKENLKRPDNPELGGSIPDEFRSRFSNIVKILATVIIPRLSPETDDTIKSKLARLMKELEEYGVPCIEAKASSIIIFPEESIGVHNKIEKSFESGDQEKINDAIEGIFHILTLYENEKIDSLPENFWDCISQQFKWRLIPGLFQSMYLIIRVLRNMPELLPNHVLKNALKSLDHLIDETNLASEQLHIESLSKLNYRLKAASLAYAIFNYLMTRDLPIPEVIDKWKIICSSPDEFAEIRNQWIIQ